MASGNQLSLFATVQRTYEVGDRVKLKRKTPAAACLKKGDIIQIAAIHPQTGSCKFWNELTESWGYVEPDEFILLPPEIDSVSLAISRYRPKGTARGGEYFRFSYRSGEKMKHIHIRGGNTDSPIAQEKVQEVRSLLAAGVLPAQVAAMLRK